jgi:hypothetical protein
MDLEVFLGSSIGKAVGSVVKGVTNAVKSVVKSDLGKAALAAAAIYFGGPMLAGATEGTAFGSTLFGSPALGPELWIRVLCQLQGYLVVQLSQFAPMSGTLASGSNSLLGGLTGGPGGNGILSKLRNKCFN